MELDSYLVWWATCNLMTLRARLGQYGAEDANEMNLRVDEVNRSIHLEDHTLTVRSPVLPHRFSDMQLFDLREVLNREGVAGALAFGRACSDGRVRSFVMVFPKSFTKTGLDLVATILKDYPNLTRLLVPAPLNPIGWRIKLGRLAGADILTGS